ncbi:hypothetical protein CFB3_22610 [Clostridium folliculivorans]|uniref:Uncharacterized protein n=1 Tax=Clostridium folliculivorans TaxID=2886038 RepID=A0A9W5XZN3_9CLOT|nr:hypothetical protein CFOLD11_08650 [Clostridium folliculivorans]GKU30154.1 hypothetical protein CFB3_22610 [Clostridium folliculivorans]
MLNIIVAKAIMYMNLNTLILIFLIPLFINILDIKIVILLMYLAEIQREEDKLAEFRPNIPTLK